MFAWPKQIQWNILPCHKKFGKFWISFGIFKKWKMHFKCFFLARFKCSSPNGVDGDVVFISNIGFGLFPTMMNIFLGIFEQLYIPLWNLSWLFRIAFVLNNSPKWLGTANGDDLALSLADHCGNYKGVSQILLH